MSPALTWAPPSIMAILQAYVGDPPTASHVPDLVGLQGLQKMMNAADAAPIRCLAASR
jgi:hypothetical protein